MSGFHQDKLSQEFDEKPFKKRIFELRDQYSPMAIVDAAIDDTFIDDALNKRMLRMMVRVRPEGSSNPEDEYLTMLADQAIGRPIDSEALSELESWMKDRYKDFYKTLVLDALQGNESAPIVQLYANILRDKLDEEQLDDIMATDEDQYITLLRNAVRRAGMETGLPRKSGPETGTVEF